MVWVIAAIVIVFLVFLYGFRKLALGLVVAALIGGVLLYQHDQQQEQRASTRIPASEIVIEKIALNPTYRSSYDISARITDATALE